MVMSVEVNNFVTAMTKMMELRKARADADETRQWHDIMLKHWKDETDAKASKTSVGADAATEAGRKAFDAGTKGGASSGGSTTAGSPEVLSAIKKAADENGIPLPVAHAIATQESRLDPNAPTGGLFQITKGTAADPGYGLAPFDMAKVNDPQANADFGMKYLAARNPGIDWSDPAQLTKALNSYNGGGDPNYVANVMRHYDPKGVATLYGAPTAAPEATVQAVPLPPTRPTDLPTDTQADAIPASPQAAIPDQNPEVFAASGGLIKKCYAAGGVVDGDGNEDESPVAAPNPDPTAASGGDGIQSAMATPAQAIPASPQAAPTPSAPAAPAPSDGLASIGEALHAGLTYLQGKFQLNDTGAISSDAASAELRRKFLAGEGKDTKEEHDATTKAVDPDSEMTESLRNVAGMRARYNYYLMQGEPEKAQKTAASMIQYLRDESARYGDMAAAKLQKGDTQGAVKDLEAGDDAIPDGQTRRGVATPDGGAIIHATDASGKTIWAGKVTPQQLMSAALGLKDGTEYYGAITQAAQKDQTAKRDPNARTPEQEAAFAREIGPQGTPVSAPQAPPQSAIPAPEQASVTPTGNAPATPAPQGAIPTPDADAQPIPLPNEPNYAGLHPSDRSAAQAIYKDRLQRREIMEKERLARVAAKEPDAPDISKVTDRTKAAEAVDASVTQFKQTLPKGQELAPADERGLTTAANHVFAGNNISANEAVDAVMDLTDPKNKALDNIKPTAGSSVKVPLRNGTVVNLDQQSLGAIKTLRDKKAADVSTKANDDKNSFAARSGRALSAIPPAVNESVRSFKAAPTDNGDKSWIKNQWDDYRNGLGNASDG